MHKHIKQHQFLLTGASGFVGKQLAKRLKSEDIDYVEVGRSPSKSSNGRFFSFVSLDGNVHFIETLKTCDVVIHLAARAHILRETASDPISEFRKVNVDETIKLARLAASVGVKRFVFVSSVGVNGLFTIGSSFTEHDIPQPHNAYAQSKFEAEQILRDIEKATGMEVVIVRPPIVYGPEVKANFYHLLRLVNSGLPIPLSHVQNKRSMIYVGNLVDALMQCATHPAAAGQTYLVSDGEAVSTTTLIRMLANSLNRPCRLLPIPLSWLKLVSGLLGKKAVLDRLTESLVIDDSKIRRDLNWQPPFTVEQGLKATAEWYRATRH